MKDLRMRLARSNRSSGWEVSAAEWSVCIRVSVVSGIEEV